MLPYFLDGLRREMLVPRHLFTDVVPEECATACECRVEERIGHVLAAVVCGHAEDMVQRVGEGS